MQQIADWLEQIGLGQYAQRFTENAIDLGVLPDLTDKDLDELGVPLGHRRRMLRAIAELDDAAPVQRDGAERRQLTIMFCDLVASTALSERLDPEDMREVICAYQAACTNVIGSYDGFIAKFMGDGILAHFGFPRAHEDDAERAVRAGLEIVSAVSRLETRADEPLKVRVGIATGLVVIGDLVGEGAFQEQAVVGHTPNLAARLQALADPGTVVVAASTRRLLGNLFALGDLGQRVVKGFAEPVALWQVEGEASSESRFAAVRTARSIGFVGRRQEIEFVLERLQLARQRQGQVVLIAGEAGIGKSRFAAAVAEKIAAEPHRRLHFQCSPYHANSALFPFIVQLERAAGIRPDDAPTQKLDKLEAMLSLATTEVAAMAPLFAALLSIPTGERYPPLGLSPAQQRRQTFAALLDQLEGLARRHTLLVVCEDIHWADATSLELFDLAVDRIRVLPILVLMTFRPRFEPPWAGLANVSLLPLERLDRRDSRAMVELVTGGRRLPRLVMEQVVAKTDGIPLFVEELTKTVLESGLLLEEADGYRLNGPLAPLAIPATLQDSLTARLDRLAPVKDVAQIGAAIGREFSYALLRCVTGRDDPALMAALAQLEEAELLFRNGTPPDASYSFKHALVQDAAYQSLLKSSRQLLHRRIADALRERFPATAESEPEVVAHHFSQAGLNADAVVWWGKAGRQSLRRSAYTEAMAHLGKAVAIADTLPDEPERRMNRLRLQILYGSALLGGLGFGAPEMAAAYARARELAAGIDDPAALLQIHLGLFNASFTRGELAAMRETSAAIVSAAESLPESRVAALLGHLTSGMTSWFQGEYLAARERLEQALAIYRGEGDPASLPASTLDPPAIVMSYLAMVLWPLGEIDRARRLADEAIARAQETERPLDRALALAARTFFDGLCGEHAGIAHRAEAILALGHEHGLQMHVAIGTYQSGLARWHAGDRPGGLSEMHRGWELLHQNGRYVLEPLTGMQVAQADAELGQLEPALAELEAVIAWAERSGQRQFDAELHRVRGELLRRRDPPAVAAAEAAFKTAIEIARSQQTRTFELRAALGLARLHTAAGRPRAARDALASALVGFDAAQSLPEIGEAQRLLIVDGDLRRAGDAIDQSAFR